MKLNTAVGVLCMLMSWLTYAQNGTIKGVITEEKTDTTLVRVSVFLDGTALGTRTNLQGQYEIKNVPPGDYKMVVNYPRKQYKKTVDVTVGPGETVEMNVAIGEEVKRISGAGSRTSLSAFVVKESSAQQVNEKKNETKAVSNIGGQAMSDQGKSTVGSAVRAVSGVSLEDGKYANIRGLNGRYVKTTLNGGEIPGLDPDRNAVQLDLFPTTFLSGLTVIKTFAPDVPGDFAGGLINIKTKDAPDSLTVKLSISGQFNPQVHMKGSFLTYEGGNSDFLGFDDGTRAMPEDVLEASQNNDMPGKVDVLVDPAERTRSTYLSRQFNPVMDAKTNSSLGTNRAFLDHGFNFTIGNTIRKKDSAGNYIPSTRKLGYFLGVNYKRTYSFYEDGEVGRYELTSSIEDVDALLGARRFTKAQSKDNVLIGGLASLNYKHSSTSKFKLNYIHNHSGTNRTSRSEGFDDAEQASVFRVVELDYVQRSIDNVQLIGEQKFHTGKNKNSSKESEQVKFKNGEHKMDWIVSYVNSKQTQPDYRVFSDELRTVNGTVTPEINPTNYSLPFRFYRYMKEANYDGKVNYKINMKETDTTHLNYKFGLSANVKDRRFEEYRYNYDQYAGAPQYNGNPDDYVATENIGTLPDGSPGLLLFETSAEKNRYDGFRTVTAGYAMTDFNIGKKLDFIGGLRAEHTLITVESDDATKPKSEINEFSYLPSLTFNYHLWDGKKVKDKRDSMKTNSRDMQVRAAYNKTLARPSFREIAPYEVEDFVRKIIIAGNQDLQMTDIHNFDVSWELYPRSNEMLTVSGFYKYFVNPMGLFNSPIANIPTFSYQNLEYSTVYGFEIEFKKKLDVLGKSFKNFAFSANLTMVKSVTPIPQDELDQIRQTDPNRKDTRPLAGQSPYLINAGLEYKHKKAGVSTNLTFNMFGDRLAVYSNDGRPDIYEKARPELNWNFKKELSKKLSIRLRIRNILNPTYRWAYEYKGNNEDYNRLNAQESNFTSYKKGVGFGVGLSYKFK